MCLIVISFASIYQICYQLHKIISFYILSDKYYSVNKEGENPMNTDSKKKILIKLFLSTLYISAFTFGGGFVIVTFMKRKFVDELHWIEENEMLDLTALAQSSPGAIAVNAAILVGWKVCGFAGMLVAVLGTIIPPMLILTIISFFYAAFAANPYVALVLKGMQAGVAAVILDVVFDLGSKILKLHKPIYLIIMVCAFLATFVFHINVIYIILVSALVGIILEVFHRRKEAVS